MYKFLILLLLSANMCASQSEGVVRNFDYSVSMSFQNGTPLSTSINGILSYCECGNPPVFVLFLSGTIQLYCHDHFPAIIATRRVAPENLEEVLNNSNQ